VSKWKPARVGIKETEQMCSAERIEIAALYSIAILNITVNKLV